MSLPRTFRRCSVVALQVVNLFAGGFWIGLGCGRSAVGVRVGGPPAAVHSPLPSPPPYARLPSRAFNLLPLACEWLFFAAAAAAAAAGRD